MYVKSTKTEVCRETSTLVWRARIPCGHSYTKEARWTPRHVTTDEYTFPPNQREVIDLVKNMAEKYDYAVEIVDMAKENIVEKLVEEIKGLDIIPTIKTNLGGRLEGSQITKKNMELLLLNEIKQRLMR